MQEALANIARHSAAESAAVSLNYLESRLEFSVRDDGKGFDPSQQHDGMGLDSMREHVEALGGDFNIESSMGKGTLIEVSLPTSQQTPDTTGSF